MRVRTAIGIAVLTIAAVGCANVGDVRSFDTDEATTQLESDEARIWYDCARWDKQIANSGAIYADAELESYLQGVVDRLYPEFQDAMHIHPFRGFVPNAFVLPNGSIYFDVGLLARIDNEAQLAAIIGHEGAHFAERHALTFHRVAKLHGNIAMVFGAATGIPLVGDVLAYSSMMGYSRDQEREADLLGYRRMEAAGYDVREAAGPFSRLAKEAAALDYDIPVFFSSHPRMSERVESFRELSASAPTGGRRGEDVYLARVERATGDTLVTYLERRQPETVIFLLEDERLLQRLPEHYRFYLAAAYRLRDHPGDAERAEIEYHATLRACPDFAPTYRALGMLRMHEGHAGAACEHFRRYLELAPEAPDRAYVESYLSKLREEMP